MGDSRYDDDDLCRVLANCSSTAYFCGVSFLDDLDYSADYQYSFFIIFSLFLLTALIIALYLTGKKAVNTAILESKYKYI